VSFLIGATKAWHYVTDIPPIAAWPSVENSLGHEGKRLNLLKYLVKALAIHDLEYYQIK